MKTPFDSAFYDNYFRHDEKYDVHYTKSRYYRLWIRAIGMLEKIGSKRVVSLGCGTGQFEQMLSEKGYDVVGVDFSGVAINKAREKSNATFLCLDLIKDYEKYKDFITETVIILETLEHIDDLALLDKLDKGLNIVFMVPSADAVSHVRTFKNIDEVKERYKDTISIMHYENHSDRFFLCMGVIK